MILPKVRSQQRPAKSEQRTAKSDNYPVRDKILHSIRERKMIHAGDRVAVAVSGGADSVALLRILLELRTEFGIVLAVAHFNHGLRGEESDADEAFVTDLARAHELDFFATHGNVRDHAFTSKLSIEAAGRELRYRWFAQLAREQRLDAIATAHTLDDQAETVLLKFLRGAGTKGLAGIWPVLDLELLSKAAGAKAQIQEGATDDTAEAAPLQRTVYAGARHDPRIVRPLLGVSRQEIEAYLTALGQGWREDASNLDRRFLRNRVRHELLPLLERDYNPKIRRLLADAADIASAEEEYWQALVEREVPARIGDGQFNLAGFTNLPLALQRRLLKRFAELHRTKLAFEHIEKLRRCALGKLKRTELPGGVVVVHMKERLELRSRPCEADPAYEVVLPIPGEVRFPELGLTVRVTVVPEELARELPQAELLDRGLMGPGLVLRNWRAGDRFCPAHSRSEEKLKRLFAERHIPEEQRASWPVAYLPHIPKDGVCGAPVVLAHVPKTSPFGKLRAGYGETGEIVWVRDFPVAQKYQWKGVAEAVRIETASNTS